MKIYEKIYDFLKSNGFELIKEDTSKFFGDYYNVFASKSFQLRFSSSKSFEAIDIRSSLQNESWYDLALVKALLYDEKKLNNVTTIEQYEGFLQQEFINIAELFDARNYPITKKKLEDLENKRVEQMFPNMKRQ